VAAVGIDSVARPDWEVIAKPPKLVEFEPDGDGALAPGEAAPTPGDPMPMLASAHFGHLRLVSADRQLVSERLIQAQHHYSCARSVRRVHIVSWYLALVGVVEVECRHLLLS